MRVNDPWGGMFASDGAAFRAVADRKFPLGKIAIGGEIIAMAVADKPLAELTASGASGANFDVADDGAASDGMRKSSQRPIKVLAVEDNAGDAALVRYALEEVKDGEFELTHADTLSAALRQLRGATFDVILLDLSLPDGSGIETLKQVQTQAADTPVIVLTGLNDDAVANAAVGAGAQDYLVKGDFDGRLLSRSIRYAIQRKYAQEAQARFQDQAGLNAIAAVVSQSMQLDEFLESVLDKVLEVTGCEMAHVRLRNPQSGELTLAAHRGLSPEHVEHLRQPRLKAGKLDQVFRSGELFVGRSENPERLARAGDRLIVWTPLKAKNKVVGVLNVSTLRRTNFSPREVDLLKAIGDVIGVGLENAQLYSASRSQLRHVEALLDVSSAAATSLNLSRVMKILTERLAKLLPYSAITIRLYDQASGVLQPAASWNVEDKDWAASGSSASGPGLSQLVFEQKKPLAIRKFLSDPRTRRPEVFRRQGLVSYLGLPMLANGEGVGVLSIYTKFEHEFPDDEIKFLAALANQAGVAIHNSQLYEQISAQAEELHRSNKVKDEFLSVMSHEFRTPLNVIMGYSELLRDGTLGTITKPQENAIGKIVDRSKDLLGLLTSVLEVTRLETDTVMLVNEVVDVASVLNEAKAAFPSTLPNGVAIGWFAPVKPLMIQTDRQKLRHIVDHLVSNAIQFTEAGTITVSAGQDPGGKTWSLSVADTGVGIPQESQPLIFQKFYQIDSSTTRSYGGIGLGLYVAHRFVELMGGTIKLVSEFGKGSTFTVTLPIDDPERCSIGPTPQAALT